MRVYKNAADFDVAVGVFGGGVKSICDGGKEHASIRRLAQGVLTQMKRGFTNIVGPLQFDGHALIAYIVGFDSFNDSKSGEVLKKNDRSVGRDRGRVPHDRREKKPP